MQKLARVAFVASFAFGAHFTVFVGACSSQSSAPTGSLEPGDGAVGDATGNNLPGTDAALDAGPGPDLPETTEDAEAGAAGLDILGDLSGTCGTIRSHLHESSPSLVENALAFGTSDHYERGALSMGGQRMFDVPNAGGNSQESEVMSFEILHYCDQADLLKTETEVLYAPPNDAGANTITDLLVTMGGERVGVSVTRAFKPSPLVMSDADVEELLVKKLTGVKRSSVRVLPQDKWVKQILHVFVVDPNVKSAIDRILPTIDASVRADTIVLVTQTTGAGFMYCDPDPPAGSECPPLPR